MIESSPPPLPDEQHDLLQLLAHAYLKFGKPQQASILLQAISALRPDDPGIAKALAYALLRSGNPEEALSLLERLREHGDHGALTYLLHGQALFLAGRADEAGRSMRMFVKVRAMAALEGQTWTP